MRFPLMLVLFLSCAGQPEVQEALGWLSAAELEAKDDGSTWCRCDGATATYWIPVTLTEDE